MYSAFPYSQRDITNTAPAELARRQILDGLERARIAADRGRHRRVRYADQRARIVRAVEPDRVLVEVSGADWAAAGSPSRGPFGADHAIVTIIDAFPALVSGFEGAMPVYSINRAGPVQLLVTWPDATTVRIVDHGDWPALALGGWLRGLPGVRPGLPVLAPGPICLRVAGEVVTVALRHERFARPVTPLADLDEDGYRAKRCALSPFDARKALDQQRETERERLRDWEAHLVSRGPFPLDRCTLTARFPDGFTLRDSL